MNLTILSLIKSENNKRQKRLQIFDAKIYEFAPHLDTIYNGIQTNTKYFSQ